jgi:hypothetical protein
MDWNAEEYIPRFGAVDTGGYAMGEHDDVVDTEATVHCPYCGELNQIALDPGSGSTQQYVEDCQICCRPWRVFVTYLPDGSAEVALEPESAE